MAGDDTNFIAQQVVFIDSNVPDIEDLIDGLAPGVEAFVLNPSSDGLQQIAGILAANNLTGLSSISIVGHGASGEIALGSAVLDDSDLSSDAASLAQIGAALAPGGDLQLFACDVASGLSGQQFIADLSSFAGGATVQAATQDIGQTANGENWTLDASTAPGSSPSTPFTEQALANYQGTLTTGTFYVPTELDGGNLGYGFDAPTIAITGNGDIVIAFLGLAFEAGSDNVEADVFDVNGNRIGSEFQGTVPYSNEQTVVDGSASNEFWIVWGVPNLTTGDDNEIFAQQFTIGSNTVTAGSTQTLLNTTPSGTNTASDNEYTSVVQLSNGDYVVAWAETSSNYSSGATEVQVFNSTFTTALTPVTTISTSGNGEPFSYDVYATSNGSSVDVTWTAVVPPTNADDDFGVTFTVGSDGSISGLTSPKNLTASLPDGGQNWRQTEFSNGDILVLYTSEEGASSFTPPDGDLYGEIFGPGFSGSPTPFEIAPAVDSLPLSGSPGTYTPEQAQAIVLPSGYWIVTYSRPSGGNNEDIYARIYDPSNNPLTNEFLVDTPASNVENYGPQIAAVNGGSGGIAFSWTEQNFAAYKYPPQDIEARIFSDIGPTSSGGTSTLASAKENSSPSGAAISSLITGTQYVSILGHTLGGIAVVGNAATAAQGTWQYSSNSGATWSNIATSVSDSSATIVAAADLLRFDPANGYAGAPGSLTVLAWDGQDGFSADSTGQNVSSFIFDTSDATQSTASFTGAFAGTSVSIATDILAVPLVTAGATATFTGGGSGVTLDTGLTVTDSSSTTLASATVTINGHIAGDTLTVGTPGGLSTSYSSGTLTLTGTASLATYQTALDSVRYSFTANGDPTGGGSHTSRTISWVVNDGTSSSSTATSTLDVTHAAPILTTSGTVNYAGGGSATTLDSTLTLSDADSGGLLSSATVRISSGFFTGDTLNATTTGLPSITATYSGGQLSLSGSDTLADYQAVLRSVTFSSTGTDPDNGGADASRTITWSINDGVASNATTQTTAVDIAPQATSAAVTAIGGAPTRSGTTGDVTTTNTVTMAVAFSQNVTVTGTPVLALNDGGSATYASGSGTSTLTFSYQPVSGQNVATLASTGLSGGTIENASGVAAVTTGAAATFTGLRVDTTAPTLSVTGTTTDAVQGGSAITVLASVAISDPDGSGTLTGATITITNAKAGDELSIPGISGGTLDGGNISVTGNNTSTLTLTGADSVAEYQTLLGEVTYQDTGTDISGGSHPTRTFDFTVSNDVLTSTVASTSVTIDVGPTVVAETGTVLAGQAVTGSGGTAGTGALAGDLDAGGNPLSISAVAGLAGNVGNSTPGNFGELTLNADGSYSYVADQTAAINAAAGAAHPIDTFQYTVSDGSNSAAATLSFTIDRPPTVATHNVSVVESASTGTVLAGDTDPDGDAVTVTALSGGTVGTALAGTYGSLTINANDTYSYAANNTAAINAAAAGSKPVDTFTYTVSDGQGSTTNETLSFTIDRPPTVATHNVSVVESASTGTVSAGDTDPDGDAVTVTALSGGTVGTALAGTYGSLTINANDTYSYAASNTSAINAAAGGSKPVDTFTYTVSDGQGGTTNETLSFTIDRPPTVATHNVSMVESASTGTVSAGDTDLDGDAVTVTALSGGTVGTALAGTYGSLTINANDTYSYAASNTSAINAAAGGSKPVDTVTYTVSDGQGGTTNETLSFTIDRPPTVATHNVSMVESASTGTVSAGDTDLDGDAVTVTALSGGTVGTALAGTYGSLTINANDTYSYAANNTAAINAAAAGSKPVDTFTYTVSDGQGSTTNETLSFTIDRPPTVATHNVSVVESASTGTVLAGDTDPDGDAVTVTALSGGTVGTALAGTYGSLTINANDTYSYAANNTAAINAAAAGSKPVDTFTYTVSDGQGSTTNETLSFTIDRPPTVATHNVSVVESASTGTVSAGDTDPDGDAVTVTRSAAARSAPRWPEPTAR